MTFRSRLFAALTLVLLIWPGSGLAQELFSQNFDAMAPGGMLPSSDWRVLGPAEGEFWYIGEQGLNTGNLDEFPTGLSWAFLQESQADEWANYTLTARVTIQQQDGRLALAIRVQDNNNYYLMEINSRQGLTMTKVVNGLPLPLQVRNANRGLLPAFGPNAGQVQVSFRANGPNLSALVNGQVVGEANDAQFSSGSIGLGAALTQLVFHEVTVNTGTQVPPRPATGGGAGAGAGAWRVVVMVNLTESDARQAAQQLESQGYQNVEALERNGSWSVYMGSFASQALAQGAFDRLRRDDGLLVEGVEQVQGSAPALAAPASSSGGGPPRYRVLVGKYLDLEKAQAQRDFLEQEKGLILVDIESEGTTHSLLAGFPLPSRQEAEQFAQQLQDEYDLSEVVVIEDTAAGGDDPDFRAADVNIGNSTDREIVEQFMGEVRAARQTGRTLAQQEELQRRLEQLSPTQRRILDEFETQASAARELERQRRDFDRQVQDALNNNDFDTALRVLQQWQAVDNSALVARTIEDVRRRRDTEQMPAGAILVDNDAGAPAFTTTGGWSTGASPGFSGRTYLVAAPGNPNTATWEAQIGQSGEYEIQAYFLGDPSRTSTTVYRVQAQDVSRAYTISQKGSTANWRPLGVINLPAGKAAISLDGQASTGGNSIAADAIRLIRRGSGPATAADRTNALISNAEEAIRSGRMEAARDLLLEARASNPSDEQMASITQRLQIVTARLEEEQTVSSGGTPMMPILGGAAGLLVVVVVVLFLMKRKKPAAAPAPAPKAATSSLAGMAAPSKAAPAKPPAQKSAEKAAPPPRPKAAPAPTKQQTAAQEAEERQRVVSDSHRILPGVTSPAQREAAAARDAAAQAGESTAVPLTGFRDDPGSSDSVAVDNGSADAPREASSETVDLPAEDLTGGASREAPAAAAAPSSSGTVPLPAAAALTGGPSNDLFFEQNFDNELTGQKPSNWQGEYDYATLAVEERADGQGKCLRFEKTQGTGSAYFHCRFPDATGRVVVEFDMCCQDKNKYLLGFYIEKDGDFRHSMHTVVHRDPGKNLVTLRLQNESHAYELGKWVHLRYLIDLPRNVVDGYVDEEPVAVGIRLASRPKMINTLSIRDNLATEGVLLIDNIRIYRDV